MIKFFSLMIMISLADISFATPIDTVFVPVHITDTVYTMAPPDTVIMQESVKDTNMAVYAEADLNTVKPAIKFYIGGITAGDLIFLVLNTLVFDFTLEKENEHRGSYMFELSSIMQFGDVHFISDAEWEGFRSIITPSFGYRHYLFTSMYKIDSKRNRIRHRNTPLNSFSFYAQAMAHPTIAYAHDRDLDSDEGKRYHFEPGIAGTGALGFVSNLGNVLFDFNVSIGYQYWAGVPRNSLFDENKENISNAFMPGTAPTGFFFMPYCSIGF